jgi:hypothetical protein
MKRLSNHHSHLATALAVCAFGAGLATSRAADSPPGKVLFRADFEADAPGGRPAGWSVFADAGNDVAVVEGVSLGRRALRFTDAGGSVWKPMVATAICGEAESFVRVDCDWRLNATVDAHEKALTLVLRGEGNTEIAAVALGGPGGAAVRQKGLGWLPLGVPLRLNEWNHLTAIADPISWGERGAYTVLLGQGSEEAVFPNIPFYPPRGVYPKEYWHSPFFALGGGAAAGAGKEAYLDNVTVEVVRGRQ